MQLPRLAVVDLETTGADPSRDRITEIGLILTEGDREIEQWSSLVDPGMPIPPRIQAFTGISDDMVAGAPSFESLAETIRAKLEGAVFVAHNARFDYGFLRAAFERCGIPWETPVVCTVKFSRALDPEFPRHGLDAIIERGGYNIAARHRALDDALIVWRFLGDALKRADAVRLQRAWDKAYSTASVPRLPRGDLEALPDSPGAYVFRSATGQILQIGRAKDLRSQVLGLFTATRNDARSKRLAANVHDVETWPAAGELGAQLKELQLLRQLRYTPATGAFGWLWMRDALGSVVLDLQDISGSDPRQWQDIYGCFRGEREARTALQELARQHRLCAARIGLERGVGPCQAMYLGRCDGVCVGKEATAKHDLRLMLALVAMQMRAWPFAGRILVREAYEGPHTGSERAETHLFDAWCHLGSAASEAELDELLNSSAKRRFDADVYRLLSRWLAAPANAASVIIV